MIIQGRNSLRGSLTQPTRSDETGGQPPSVEQEGTRPQRNLFAASAGIAIAGIFAVVIMRLRPAQDMDKLVRLLEGEMAKYLTRSPTARLVNEERVLFRLRVENLLRTLSQAQNDLPVVMKFPPSHKGILPEFTLLGRMRRIGDDTCHLILQIESPDSPRQPMNRIRRMVMEIPLKGRHSTVDWDHKKIDCGRFFDDDATWVSVITESGGKISAKYTPIRRSHLGLVSGQNPENLFPGENGFRFTHVDEEGLRQWGPLLEEGRWPAGLQLEGHLPQPILYRNALERFSGTQLLSRRGAAEVEAFFPVVGTTPTPWAVNRGQIRCGAFYRYNKHGRLEKMGLAEVHPNGTRKTLFEIEYTGGASATIGAPPPDPFIDERDLESLLMPRIAHLSLVEDQAQRVRGQIRSVLTQLLREEETTLPTGIRLFIDRPQQRRLVNLSGVYRTRDGVWHLDLTVEDFVESQRLGSGTITQSIESKTIQVPINRSTGRLDLTKSTEVRSQHAPIEDPLRRFVVDTSRGAKGKITVYRQLILGSPLADLRKAYPAAMVDGGRPEGYNISYFSDQLFLRWGALLDDSPVKPFIFGQGRLPGVIRTEDELLRIIDSPGFPRGAYEISSEGHGSYHIFRLAKAPQLPWASNSAAELKVVYEFDREGRFVQFWFAEETPGKALDCGLVVEASSNLVERADRYRRGRFWRSPI